jgi:hypothetical protein
VAYWKLSCDFTLIDLISDASVMITDKWNRKRYFLALDHQIYRRLIFFFDHHGAEAEALAVHMVRLGNEVISAKIHLHIVMHFSIGHPASSPSYKEQHPSSPLQPQHNRDKPRSN